MKLLFACEPYFYHQYDVNYMSKEMFNRLKAENPNIAFKVILEYK